MFWERFRFFEDFTGFPYPYALLVVGWLLAGLALAAILFFIGTRTLDLPIASGLVMIVLAFQLVFPAFIIFSATDFLSYNGIFVELDAVLSMPFPSVVSLIGLGIFYIMNKKS
jgi:hypothetical protein